VHRHGIDAGHCGPKRGGPHRRHGFGPPWGGPGEFGGFPFGGFGPRGRGRKARRGDIRTAALLLLAEEPRNGYQIMQEVEERSDGAWRPSPGSVYPALQQLEDEGLIRSQERDGRKLFELTDAGRKLVSDRDAPWDAACDPSDELAEALHALIGQVHLAAMQVARAGDVRQLKHAADLLARCKRDLYRVLAEDADA